MPKPTARPYKGYILSDDPPRVRRAKSFGPNGDGIVRLPRDKYAEHEANVDIAARVKIGRLRLELKEGKDVLSELIEAISRFNDSKKAMDAGIAGPLDGCGGGPGYAKRGNLKHFTEEDIAKMALEIRKRYEAAKGTRVWIDIAIGINFEFTSKNEHGEIVHPVAPPKAKDDMTRKERKTMDRFHKRLREDVLPQVDEDGKFDRNRKLLKPL